MNTQEQQIAEINSIAKATLGRSEIDGIGVIAITNIRKGETIYADRMPKVYHIPYGSLGKLFPRVRKIILERWPSIINGSKFIYPDARLVSFMNHGGGDKANYDPYTDTVVKDVRAGEEILENYKRMENWGKIWPPEKNSWIND